MSFQAHLRGYDQVLTRPIFLCFLLLVIQACAPALRIEPVVGDSLKSRDSVISHWKKTAALERCTDAWRLFLLASEKADHNQIWNRLSPGYQDQWESAASRLGLDAKTLFMESRLPIQGTPSFAMNALLMGPHPFYLTDTPPELPVIRSKDREICHWVQEDGGFVSFLVIRDSGKDFIEPLSPIVDFP